jgi:putative FmdB family regulatory protein
VKLQSNPSLQGRESARIIYSTPWPLRRIKLMPIYEYQCRKCKAHIEVFQKMTDKPPVKCRKCGGRLEKLLSAPAIQFKGSGWYVTDYSSKGKATEKADSEAASSTGDKKEAGSDKKPEQKTKEGSPVKKTSEKTSSTKSPSGD